MLSWGCKDLSGIKGPLPTPSYHSLLRLMELLPVESRTDACLGRHLAVDGKVVRGSNSQGRAALACTLYDVTARQVVAQSHGLQGSEVGLVHGLLETDLSGALVSMDALHTLESTARLVLQAGGHYLMSVKANQPGLLAELEEMCWQAADVIEHSVGHHRREIRMGESLPAPTGIWPGAVQVLRLTRVRRHQDHRRVDSKATAYVLTSLPGLGTEDLMDLVRKHWSIENGHHRPKDVLLDEDISNLRGRRAAVMSALRSRVVDALHRAGGHQLSRVYAWLHGRVDRALRLLAGEVEEGEVRDWCPEGRRRT